MNEKLLQYIWQFQLYNKVELQTSDGESLQIISPGYINHHQGPDFLNAKIKIGNTLFVGNIEVHFRSSDWQKHGHSGDMNYQSVILHVVWEQDKIAETALPVFTLKERVPKILLERYSRLLGTVQFIPCEKNILQVNELVWVSWRERLLAERLIRKADRVADRLAQTGYNWEEVCWWMMARNFGIKVNADAFEEIARSIPHNLLAKIKHQYHAVEALLMGQAGLLNSDFKEDYPNLLKREYLFLQAKYRLEPIRQSIFFLRMRPVNFPTIRLAQLAMLIYRSSHLFSTLKETENIEDIYRLLSVTGNDYWHYHYRFDEQSKYKEKVTGRAIKDNVIINTIVPLLFAYGKYHNDNTYKGKALRWLREIKAEENTILKEFKRLGIAVTSAYDSQALIELNNEYCVAKKCLSCSVGNSILRGEQ